MSYKAMKEYDSVPEQNSINYDTLVLNYAQKRLTEQIYLIECAFKNETCIDDIANLAMEANLWVKFIAFGERDIYDEFRYRIFTDRQGGVASVRGIEVSGVDVWDRKGEV